MNPETRRSPVRSRQPDAPKTPATVPVTTLTRPGGLTGEQVELIKRTVAKGATDDELAMFLYQCKRLGMDPLSRQIHFVKRWDSREQREVGAIQTGIDGFRLLAARTGCYRPDEEPPRYTYDEASKVRSARVRIWVYHAPTMQWHPVEAEAHFEEYAQRTKDGTLFPNWARMPRVMTAKCAEALAIRKAFPAELSGVYELAEIGGPLEPAEVPASAPQTELPSNQQGNGATPTQREAIHRVWHSRTRGRFSDHDETERALDAWLRFHAGVESTTALTFQQAAQALAALQKAVVDELIAVAVDAMKGAADASQA